jgi:hypothetical protein
MAVASNLVDGAAVNSLMWDFYQEETPGLEEVIGSHLLAGLVKPLDIAELCFILKTISENLSSPAMVTEA